MAEGKKSVIIYADLIATVSRMPREERGDLLMLILEYINDLEPDEEKYGILVSVAFGPVKQQMKRDLVKWRAAREQRSGAGKASAEAKRLRKLEELNEIQQTSTPVDLVQRDSTKSTVTVNVTVNTKVLNEVIEYFGISKNQREKMNAEKFLSKLTEIDRYNEFLTQFEAYRKVMNFKHKFDKFIGCLPDYSDGQWCYEDYTLRLPKPKKSTTHHYNLDHE